MTTSLLMTQPDASQAATRPASVPRRHPLAAGLVAGAWLAVAAVWPSWRVTVGAVHLLWQPVLMCSLLITAAISGRRDGYRMAAAQAVVLYAVFTLSGWLASLHTTSYWTVYPYPRAYGGYLVLYEAVVALLVGYWGARAVLLRDWRLPSAVAPVLLLLRGWQVGHWVVPLAGVACGVALAGRQGWRSAVQPLLPKVRRVLPMLVFLSGLLIVWGSSLRIYSQTGADFPIASDDGKSYNFMAIDMAAHPGYFFGTELKRDQLHFTGYFPLMALWIRLVGYHIPSWLFWHGVAGGLLALAVYWVGAMAWSARVGVAAAGLVIADRVTLHLMSTMNMETFFLPALYLSVVLWCRAASGPATATLRRSAGAGAALGAATWFRVTSVLLPVAWLLVAHWERPRRTFRSWWRQGAGLLAGFGVPVGLLVLHHRFAWGYWSLSGLNGKYASGANYALEIQGHQPASIGLGPWLQLLAQEPSVIWTQILPGWAAQLVSLWTHTGFGQMDLVKGLNHEGPYQAAVTTLLALGMVIGAGLAVTRRRRVDMALVTLPAYFSALVLAFWVVNARYRAPFIPALLTLCCVGYAAIARAAGTPDGSRAMQERASCAS